MAALERNLDLTAPGYLPVNNFSLLIASGGNEMIITLPIFFNHAKSLHAQNMVYSAVITRCAGGFFPATRQTGS